MSPLPCHPTCLRSPSAGGEGQSVSCRGPPVRCVADSHLGRVSSRQPGIAGTVGTGQAYRGDAVLSSLFFHTVTHMMKLLFHSITELNTQDLKLNVHRPSYPAILQCPRYCRYL